MVVYFVPLKPTPHATGAFGVELATQETADGVHPVVSQGRVVTCGAPYGPDGHVVVVLLVLIPVNPVPQATGALFTVPATQVGGAEGVHPLVS